MDKTGRTTLMSLVHVPWRMLPEVTGSAYSVLSPAAPPVLPSD